MQRSKRTKVEKQKRSGSSAQSVEKIVTKTGRKTGSLRQRNVHEDVKRTRALKGALENTYEDKRDQQYKKETKQRKHIQCRRIGPKMDAALACSGAETHSSNGIRRFIVWKHCNQW